MIKRTISVSGKKGSGKTTVVRFLLKATRRSSYEVMLADLLKKTCSTLFGIEYLRLGDQAYKETPFERPIMVTLEQLEMILDVFKIKLRTTDEVYHCQSFENRCFNTPRELLQIIGTEFLHELGGKTIHCRRIKKGPTYHIPIISDLRFQAEFDYFQKAKGEFYPIYLTRGTDNNEDTHRSETEMEQFKDQCFVIDNNGSLDDLYGKLLLWAFNNHFL